MKTLILIIIVWIIIYWSWNRLMTFIKKSDSSASPSKFFDFIRQINQEMENLKNQAAAKAQPKDLEEYERGYEPDDFPEILDNVPTLVPQQEIFSEPPKVEPKKSPPPLPRASSLNLNPTPDELQNAIVWLEILSPPLALRDDERYRR